MMDKAFIILINALEWALCCYILFELFIKP